MRCAGLAVAAVLMGSVLAPGTGRADDDLVRGLLGIGAAAIMNGMQPREAPPGQQPIGRVPARVRDQPSTDLRESSRLQTLAGRRDVQMRLDALGYDAGPPDGAFGPRTRRAIALFQSSIGHRPSGIMTESEVMLLVRRTGNEGTTAQGFAAFGSGSRAPSGSPGFPAFGAPRSGGGTAFPPLGGAARSTAGGAFPPLGEAGAGRGANTAGGAFPQLGRTAPASGAGMPFPKLGAGPADTSQASAFPKIGSTPEANPSTAGFPALAATPTQKSAVFPSVAAPQVGAEPTVMPELATAPPAADPSMPALSKPPETPPAPMPSIAKPHPGAAVGDDPGKGTTLVAEAAQTPFGSVAKLPDVLGIRLGDKREAALDRLKAAGFSGCTDAAATVMCTRTTPSLTDTLTLRFADDSGTWAIMRTLAFTSPMEADVVLAPFEATFPELMNAEGNRVASQTGCGRGIFSDAELGSVVQGIAAVDTGKPEPAAFADFARRCPLVLSLSFDGTDRLSGAHLTFVDLSAVTRRAAADSARAASEEKARRDRFSSDLKL